MLLLLLLLLWLLLLLLLSLLSILYTNFHYGDYLLIFTIVTTYILTLLILKFDFHFDIAFFSQLCVIIFVDFSYLFLCHCSLTIAFRLPQLTATIGGELKSMNSNGIVYSYLSTPIGKPFLVSIFLLCSLPIKSWCHKFFELSLANTITVLMPVSCDHVTYFIMMTRRQGM